MDYTVEGVASERPFRIARLGHTGWSSIDLLGTIDFLRRRLGLMVSDAVTFPNMPETIAPDLAKAYFVRCASDHHTLVLASREAHLTRAPADSPMVGQLSWQVGTLRQVSDGIDYLKDRAVLGRLGRDCPGSNWHVYFSDPDGYTNELFYGMEQIGWDGRSKPVSMYDRGFRERFTLPQIAEEAEVERAAARGDVFDGWRDPIDGAATFDLGGVIAERPFRVTRLGRMLLDVRDLEASVRFYVDVLGLRETERRSVDGHTCVFLRAGEEHHSLVLCERGLFAGLGFRAAAGLAVPDYGQILAARDALTAEGLEIVELPPALSAGISYGFWVKGPDEMGFQLFTGMQRVERDGSAPQPSASPPPLATWPERLPAGERGWYEPPFLGPLA